MQNFAGMLEYLCSWRWGAEEGIIKTSKGFVFKANALPFLVDDDGGILALGKYEPGAAVFADDRLAFEYLLSLTKRDLQYPGMRDDRL